MKYSYKLIPRTILNLLKANVSLPWQLFKYKKLAAYLSKHDEEERNYFAEALSEIKLYDTNASDFIEKNAPSLKQNDISEADRILKNEFELLGATIKPTPIDWHYDYLHSFSFPEMPVTKLKKIVVKKQTEEDYDRKVPRELSKFYHFITLGKAFLLTNNRVYYEKFKSQIKEWQQNNPFRRGINWTVTMDISIRLINVLVSIKMFEEAIREDDGSIMGVLIRFIRDHMFFINNNIDKSKFGYTNNHSVGSYLGLFVAGLFYKNTKYGREYLETGQSGLEQCMREQVDEDGVHFENSIYYHCLVLEMFIFVLYWSRLNNFKFSDNYIEKLGKMLNFLNDIIRRDGTVPNVGDSDGSRLVRLGHYYGINPNDFSYLLQIGQRLFNTNKCSVKNDLTGDGYIEWLFSSKPCTDKYLQENISRAYNPGYLVIKTDRVNILLNCNNPNKRTFGGHKHNDLLSFVYALDDKQFFVDSGTYTYSGDLKARLKFRSVTSHNTVQFGEEDQNKIFTFPVFPMEIKGKAQLESWKDTDQNLDLTATFVQNKEFKFERSVYLTKDTHGIAIIDNTYCPTENTITSRFHLHPGCTISKKTEGSEEAVLFSSNIFPENVIDWYIFRPLGSYIIKNEATVINFIVLAEDANSEISIKDSQYSPGYGTILPNKCIQIRKDQKRSKYTIVYIIIPDDIRYK